MARRACAARMLASLTQGVTSLQGMLDAGHERVGEAFGAEPYTASFFALSALKMNKLQESHVTALAKAAAAALCWDPAALVALAPATGDLDRYAGREEHRTDVQQGLCCTHLLLLAANPRLTT